VISEIKFIQEEYNIHWFRFPDDNLFMNKKWIREFCDTLTQNKINIKWTALARSQDLMDIELLELIKRAGCQEIFIGVESGYQPMLNAMNKNCTVEENGLAVSNLREVGIQSSVYILFGYPSEGEDNVNAIINWLKEFKPDKCRVHVFTPFPGLDIWENPELYGIKIDKGKFDYWDFLDFNDFGYEYSYLNKEGLQQLKEKLIAAITEMGYYGKQI